MRLTTFTDYSLRVLLFVGAHPEGRTTIAEIATAFSISQNHLTKVVHFLGKAGFLRNVRGRGGGLELARPAAQINVGDVVEKAEGDAVPAECFEAGGNRCTIARACRLRVVLGEAVRAFNAVLAAYTLEDLLVNRQAIGRMMFAPRPARSVSA